jgi:tRNA (guanosine-2'-O-)-methyltransferase
VKQLNPTELKRLHREWRRKAEGRLALLLDSVQTPYNVGSILRMAAAYRVDHLWLAGASATPSHPGTRKTALGSDRFLTWSEVERPEDAVAEAHDDGYRVIGIELAHGAVAMHDLDLSGDICLAVGHEDRGLSAGCLQACDHLAYLPQLGRIGSLNVAAATAIALYEVRRQEWTR